MTTPTENELTTLLRAQHIIDNALDAHGYKFTDNTKLPDGQIGFVYVAPDGRRFTMTLAIERPTR